MAVGTLFLMMLLGGIIIVGVVALASYMSGRAPRALTRAERNKLDRAEATMERLYDAALNERELGATASPFADIVIDEVRSYQRRNKELEQ